MADAANVPLWAGRTDDADPTVYSYTLDGSVREEVRRPVTSAGAQEVTSRSYRYDEQNLPVQMIWGEFASEWDYETITPRASGTYSYRYSGSGQRVWESAGGTVRRTVRGASGEALAVFDGAGKLKHWNMSGGLGRVEASGLKYY